MATLNLVTTREAPSDTPFPATVEVRQAPPGTDITVILNQTARGLPPLYTEQAVVQSGPDGRARADFQVVLRGVAGDTLFAVLVASATDPQNSFYEPDAEMVLVS
jgi:hypothetical protein